MVARVVLLLWLSCLLAPGHIVSCSASSGDRREDFIACLDTCQKTGCLLDCIPGCKPPVNGEEISPAPADGKAAAHDNATAVQYVTEPWDLRLLKWSCESECQFQCMEFREKKKVADGVAPEKYYGKWPFKRVLGMQEPASVAFSLLNFLTTLGGLVQFVSLVYGKLPRKPMGDKGPLYEYAGLWIVYGLLSLNSWFWSVVFHGRDTPLTQALDYSSAIALIGGVLLLAFIRTMSLRLEAARVMVSAPIIAFTATHILYLNFFRFDYGWNMIVCTTMGIWQLLLWVVWAYLTRHPSRIKLWVAVIGTSMAMLLEVYDFPPFWGYFDAHSLWHAATIPLIALWWSFICDDAKFRSQALLQRGSASKEKKAK